MGKDSKIEWTDHTFNPWRGCTKVSAGCAHCYAESFSRRNPGVLGVWGDGGTRVIASESKWREPIAWNRAAHEEVYKYTLEERQAGRHLLTRPRVFCASLADVFEDRQELIEPRRRLFRLIDSTPFLDWLLLTKRPENISRLWPENPNIDISEEGEPYHIHLEGRNCDATEGDCCWGSGWLPNPYPIPSDSYRPNVWLGTSVENQEQADKRIPELLKIPAAVRFLSMEPLLGPVDLLQLSPGYGLNVDALHGESWSGSHQHTGGPRLDWVIVGGESGPGARPMHTDSARSLRDQCREAGVAFYMKQMGASSFVTLRDANNPAYRGEMITRYSDRKGAAMDLWPKDLRIREMPKEVACRPPE